MNGKNDTLPDDDVLIREYETLYGADEKRKNAPKRKRQRLYFPPPDATERRWAMLAHASTWLTLLGGTVTLGIVVPFSIFIPLIIYLNFRKKSDFIAFHALQAFAIQIIGTVGVVVIGVVGGILWSLGLLVALLLILALIGIVLVIVWGLVGLLFAMFTALLPILMLVFATIAAIQTHNGRDYRYPLIGRWLERRMIRTLP